MDEYVVTLRLLCDRRVLSSPARWSWKQWLGDGDDVEILAITVTRTDGTPPEEDED